MLLVLLRILQGFGAGAELAGAFVYVTESAPAGRRAFLASFSSAATSVGLLLSTGVFALLEALLSRAEMLSWGWRVPFLLSGLVVLAALAVRRRLEESAEFRRHLTDPLPDDASAPGPSGARRVLAGLLAPTVLGVGAYVISVWAVGAVTSRGLGADVALLGVLLLAATSAVSCVLFGRLADRVGAGRVFVGGAVFTALFAFPFLALLDTGDPLPVVLALVVGYAVGWGACAGAQGAYLPALFSTGRRFAGVAITRELNSAALAGPAPFLAVALTAAAGDASWPVGLMLVVAALLTLLGVGLARDDPRGQASRTSRAARSSTTA